MTIGTIILAAGMGKRMNSEIPKVIHSLMGKPLLAYAIETARSVSDIPPVVVVGFEKEKVQNVIEDDVMYVTQEKQLGTAHAVLMAEACLKGKADLIVITSADMPLVSAETLKKLINLQGKNNGAMTLVSIKGEESRGFGRILRDEQGKAVAIIEEKAATA